MLLLVGVGEQRDQEQLLRLFLAGVLPSSLHRRRSNLLAAANVDVSSAWDLLASPVTKQTMSLWGLEVLLLQREAAAAAQQQVEPQLAKQLR